MSEKIVEMFPSISPDVVLEAAKGEYQSVFVIGYDNDGNLDPRASKNLNGKDVLWLMEQFKAKLMNGDYSE